MEVDFSAFPAHDMRLFPAFACRRERLYNLILKFSLHVAVCSLPAKIDKVIELFRLTIKSKAIWKW